MEEINKLIVLKNDALKYCASDNGYFVTLNSRFNEATRFEQDLLTLTKFLNEYCFGRSFRRENKRLKIHAVIEEGNTGDNLHTHMVITDPLISKRSYQEIAFFIRKTWAKIIGINNLFGNMIDVQKIDVLLDRIHYLHKELTVAKLKKGYVMYL